MTIHYITPFLLIALFAAATLIDRYNKKMEREAMPDLPGSDEMTYVDFKGFVIPMTHLEKVEYWDNMTMTQKVGQVRKIKARLREGSLVAVYNDENRVVYVSPEMSEKRKYKKAGPEYYNLIHARKQDKKKKR